MRFVIRLLITVSVILLCTWIADRHRLPSLAGLIAVMPLTGLFVLVWLYQDQPRNFVLMADYTRGALLVGRGHHPPATARKVGGRARLQ
jgi:hypothetical protein